MESGLFTCKTCDSTVDASLINSDELAPCSTCSSVFQIRVYPALFEGPKIEAASEKVVLQDESSCYYHEDKRAVVPCDGCGRFLCALCDIEMYEQHLCPKCMEKGFAKDSARSFKNEYTYYDSLALALALLPLIFWPFTLFTAPYSIYIAIRYWKTPMSILPRLPWRSVLAILISSLQLGGWGLLFLNIAAEIF